jgi:hypothetical protein
MIAARRGLRRPGLWAILMRVTQANARQPSDGDTPAGPATIDLDEGPEPGRHRRFANTRAALADARTRLAAKVEQPGTKLTLQGLALAALMVAGLLAGALIVAGDGSPMGGDNQPRLPAAAGSPSTSSIPTTAPAATTSPSGTTATTARTDPGPAAYLGWARDLSARLDVPAQALAAYAYAERVMAVTQPSCRLNWTTLAGIGKVASNHGLAGGATLEADGVSSPKILGPALDGRSGRAEVRDTDLGVIDGDRIYDRAVGPMQFVPAAWRVYGQNADADSDGRADINDIDDAALAAARLLCAGGRDLGTVDGWDDGIKKFNYLGGDLVAIFNAADDYGKRSRESG